MRTILILFAVFRTRGCVYILVHSSIGYSTVMFSQSADGGYDICQGCDVKIKVGKVKNPWNRKRHLESKQHETLTSLADSRAVITDYFAKHVCLHEDGEPEAKYVKYEMGGDECDISELEGYGNPHTEENSEDVEDDTVSMVSDTTEKERGSEDSESNESCDEEGDDDDEDVEDSDRDTDDEDDDEDDDADDEEDEYDDTGAGESEGESSETDEEAESDEEEGEEEEGYDGLYEKLIMSSSEKRAMRVLLKVSEKIVFKRHLFESSYRTGCELERNDESEFECEDCGITDRKWRFAPYPGSSHEGDLDELSRIIFKKSDKLYDLVKHSDITMLKSVNKLFHTLVYNKDLRKYMKEEDKLIGSNWLLEEEEEFMEIFVTEASPEKKRKILLKKLNDPGFRLPRLLLLYVIYKDWEETSTDIKPLPEPTYSGLYT